MKRRHQLAVAAAFVALFAAISGSGVVGLVLLAIPVAGAVWLRVSPGLLVAIALATMIFSTHSGDMGLPVDIERVFLAAGLASLAAGLPFGRQPLPRLRWRSVHTMMVLAVGIVVISMIATVSKVGATDKFTLLDDFGVIPFLLFSLAPILYPNRKERSRLVAVLVVTGWYLAVTAFLEGVGLKNLVWPTYINDPNIGIHFDRARGPFVEATINGLGLIGGATAGLIGLQIWRQRAARWAAGLLIPASLLGAVLTLTRSVWIAGAAFTAVAIIGHPRTRKFAFPIAIATFVGVLLAFALVPGLTSNAEARASDQRPVWDRLNNNRAAVAAFEDNPLFGVGWQRMQETSYALQADTYPLTGGKVRVHNVFLSNLAELGLVGFVPWLAAFILGVVVSAVRRVPPTLRPWRQGLQCYLLAWLAVAMFAPLAGPFPNSLLWLLAGIVASPYTSSPPALARVEPAEAVR